jgi:hypothetical protein
MKITKEAHSIVKEFCKKNHLKINDWSSEVLITMVRMQNANKETA